MINALIHEKAGKAWTFFIAGLFFGCAALCRYHVLVGACALIGSLALVYRRRWKGLALCAAGVAAAYAPQAVIYFLSKPHTVHFAVMNIYNLMYPLSWYHTITLHLPDSPLDLIAANPLLFAKKYAIGVAQHALAFAPPMAALFLVKDAAGKKLCGALVLWTTAYSLFFGAMTSSRSLLLALPLSFLCCAAAARHLARCAAIRLPRKLFLTAAASVVTAAFALFGGSDIVKAVHRRGEHLVFSAVETYLHSQGCRRVNEIFSTDFYLYFRTMPPYMPYFNGGAPRWGVYKYNEEFPEFPDATLQEFSAACRERGVRFVLLISPCRLRSHALGELFDRPNCSADFAFKKEIGRFRIYTVAH